MKLTPTMESVLRHMKAGRSAYFSSSNTGARTRCLLAMRSRGLLDLARGGEWVMTSKGRKS